jgi:hypothetical protein
MSTTKTLTVALNTSVGTVPLLVPVVKVGGWEAFGLSCRGVIDSFGNRKVPDGTPTHTLHGLESDHRHGEAEMVRRANTVVSQLVVEIAHADQEGARTLPPVASTPSAEDLARLQGKERQLWADQARDADRAKSARSSAARTISDAQNRAVMLRAEVLNVVAETRAASQLWKESYRRRAARYTRARFSWFGLRPTAVPEVASYRSVGEPDTARATSPVTALHLVPDQDAQRRQGATPQQTPEPQTDTGTR